MTPPMPPPPRYPTIEFIVRFGEPLAMFTAALPLAGAVAVALAGTPWWIVPAGLAASAYLFLFLRSYVELIRAVADTLLPR